MPTKIENRESLAPFVKWAGGKRWLCKTIERVVPPHFSTYIEPFLGGGAIFLSSSKRKSLLGDTNFDLINTYVQIRNDWRAVEQGLAALQKRHSDDFYYQMRKHEPLDLVDRALRFLYLNRTCWNGLYRVNKKGQFNVPRGTKNTVVLDSDNFELIAARLKNAYLVCQDFEETINAAGPRDFVFVDPPYTVQHNFNGFVKYNEKIFSWADQIRLKNAVARAATRGAVVTLTNADHISIRELYSNSNISDLESFNRASVLAGNAQARTQTSELIIKIGW